MLSMNYGKQLREQLFIQDITKMLYNLGRFHLYIFMPTKTTQVVAIKQDIFAEAGRLTDSDQLFRQHKKVGGFLMKHTKV